MNMASITDTGKLNLSALSAGFLSFIGLYFLLSMAMIFGLSLFSQYIDSNYIYLFLKIAGLLSWALPGYVAARIADEHFILHGLTTGLLEGVSVSAFLFFTFSWDAGYGQVISSGILLSLAGATLLGTLGGIAARYRARTPERK